MRIYCKYLNLIILFLMGMIAYGQPVRKIQTFYQKFDSIGLSIPVKEEYYVLEGDTLKHGSYKKFNQEGEVIISGVYHYGKKDSIFTEYYQGEIPHRIIPYKDDIISGDVYVYSFGGDLEYKESYNGNRYKKSTKDNKVLAEGFFSNGLLDSTLIEYYPDGKVKKKDQFKDGKRDGKSFIYDKKGTLIQELEYRNGVIDGEIISYNPDGKIKIRAKYKDGELNGIVREYYPNGNIKTESTYKNNVQDGAAKSYYEDGKLKSEEFYIQGTLHGYFKTYYPEGGIYTESIITDGKRNGEFKSYNRKGILILEGGYKDGILEGDNKAYYDDGKIKHKFNYKNGKKIGKNITYFPNGNIEQEEIIKDDDKVFNIKIKHFYESGNLERNEELIEPKLSSNKSNDNRIKVGEWTSYYDKPNSIKTKEFFQNDKLHGERFSYFEDGTLSSKEIYSNGVKTGIWISYFPNGKVKSETSYKNSTFYGPIKTYYESGKIESTGHYINNKKNGEWRFFNDQGKLLKTQTYKNGEMVKEKLAK